MHVVKHKSKIAARCLTAATGWKVVPITEMSNNERETGLGENYVFAILNLRCLLTT